MAKRQSGAFAARWRAKDGEDGLGISRTEIRYQIGDSGTVAPTGTWLEAPPVPQKGKYLWTRTIIFFTNGTWNQVYSVSYYANDGDDGAQGPAGPYPIKKKWVAGDTHTRNQYVIDHIYAERGSREDSDWYVRIGEGSVIAGEAPAKALTDEQLEMLGYLRITSSYTTLATDVFIANEANVAGFIMKDGVFWSQRGMVGNDEVDYKGQPGFVPNIMINGLTGEVVFNNGTLRGNIDAFEGFIGGIAIANNGLGISTELSRFVLRNEYLFFRDNNSLKTIRSGVSQDYMEMLYIRDWTSGNKIGIRIDMDGTGDNCAILLDGGYIGGLAYNVKKLTNSQNFYTITNKDVVISCEFTQARTINLPPAPRLGEVKIISNKNNQNIAVNGNVNKINWGTGNLVDTFNFGPGHSVKSMNVQFIFDGTVWLSMAM